MEPHELEEGQVGTLKEPYRGYRRVEFVEDYGIQVVVKICDSGLEITVWRDEVIWAE